MSRLAITMELDAFENLPLTLDEQSLHVTGRSITATIDLSPVAQAEGQRLQEYLRELDRVLGLSHFRWHCHFVVHDAVLQRLSCNLSRIHWKQVDFRATDFQGSTIEGAVRLTGCVLDDALPPLDIAPGQALVYPPDKAARDLALTGVKEQLVLRWGLTREGGNLAQALLWLEPHHPTRALLQKLLRPHDRRTALSRGF